MGYLFLCARLTAPLFYYRSSAGTPPTPIKHSNLMMPPQGGWRWQEGCSDFQQFLPQNPFGVSREVENTLSFHLKTKKKTIGAKANPNHWGALHQPELVCIGQIFYLRS